MFYAIKGIGAFLNNKKIFVSKKSHIEEIIVATGFPYIRDGRVEEIMKPSFDFKSLRT